MKRLLLLCVVLFSSLAFSDSCATGSLAFYLANPCTIGNVTVQPLSFSATVDGLAVTLDPSQLMVDIHTEDTERILTFEYLIDVLPGHVVTVDTEALFILPVQTYLFAQPFGTVQSGTGASITISQEACLNGTFSPSCTGLLLPDSPTSGISPPSTLDVVQHWDISTSDHEVIITSLGYDVAVEKVSVAPEPTSALMMISVLPLLWRKRVSA
jgi:hypothetical protein